MNKEFLQQAEEDMELVKNMTTIQSTADLRALVNRMIETKQTLDEYIIEERARIDKIDKKSKNLMEYIRNVKDYIKEMSINQSMDRKHNNY